MASVRNVSGEDKYVPLLGRQVADGEIVTVAAELLEFEWPASTWQVDTDGGQTVAQVLAEVGDDPEKARRALDAEQSAPAPRKTLVSQLETIADRDTEE
jgi:hypothetical protein